MQGQLATLENSKSAHLAELYRRHLDPKISNGGDYYTRSSYENHQNEMVNPSSLDSVAQAVEDIRKDILELGAELKGIRTEQRSQSIFQNRLVGGASVITVVLFIICGVAVYHFGRWETAFNQIAQLENQAGTIASESQSNTKDIIALKQTDDKHTDRLNKQDNRLDAIEQSIEKLKAIHK
jgi:hypothetical protein